MGREIRHVPENWSHPKRDDIDEFIPLHQEEYLDALERWHECVEAYGFDLDEGCGEAPRPEDYMPEGPWVQLYEDVSEGTPLSPPFATEAELIDWLAENEDYWGRRRTRVQAEALVTLGRIPSLMIDEGVFYDDVTMAEHLQSTRSVRKEATS